MTALEQITRAQQVGRNMRLGRALAGEMSQGWLAERLDMQRHHVSRYENGRAEPSYERVVRIAEVFEVPHWSWLYEPHPELERILTPEQRQRFKL